MTTMTTMTYLNDINLAEKYVHNSYLSIECTYGHHSCVIVLGKINTCPRYIHFLITLIVRINGIIQIIE
jgi:hypothetical protein